MFKHFFKVGLRLAPVIILPWMTYQHSCFWWNKPTSGANLKSNKLENRVHQSLQISNSPCEDRSDVYQLTSIDGYAAAVYDGHGGWQVSQLCSQKLLKKLDQYLKLNKDQFKDSDELIKKSITDAFLSVQKQFLDIARESYKYGFGKAARAGSCALVCVVHNNKVYCGNVGDSLGLLIHEDKPMGFTEINRFLNADNPDEQARLKHFFPDQEDIVVCKKPNNTSCYVKGRLQPTRSIGDFRLKHPQFNNPKNYSREMEYQPQFKRFTGNYIIPIPEIKVFQLNKHHKSIILASDGLWDELGTQEVAEVFRSNPVSSVPSILIQKSLQKAAQDSKLTVPQIRKIPQGKKRKIHDDITIVVIDLQKQLN